MTYAHIPEDWREIQAAQQDKGIRKRTFTVAGPQKVAGASTGETVELEFPEDVIDILITAGVIKEQAITFVGVADGAQTEDVAGPLPVETRATRARSTGKDKQ